MRKKKLLMNTVSAIINQSTTLVCGLILPRLIISHYGSETNGLLSSITQFLAFFSMMEMGVGAVVRASLYQPLAKQDSESISRVLISSKRFFSKIGIMMSAYAIVLMFFFPISVDNKLGYISTALLVGSVAFNSISTYLFGIVYTQLLNADQKSYIQLTIAAFTTILNTAISVMLIQMNMTIVTVKIVTAFTMLLKPLMLKVYVCKNYKLNLKLSLTEEPLKQKWNGLAQHIATYVLKHADTIILTFFSTLENVSIYYVYHLVTNGLQQLVEILTTGVQALFGNMYAQREYAKLQNVFSSFEWIMHTFVTLIYSIAGVMIIPFVRVYTKGINDANYVVPVFAFLIVLANGSFCIRMPYNIMIHAAGHFKQTQASAILEALLNVIISMILVHNYGLVGVAIGTFIAMSYRTIFFAFYLRKNILNRSLLIFIKHVLVDILIVGMILLATKEIEMGSINWFAWIIMGIKVSTVSIIVVIIVNFVFYRETIRNSIQLFWRKY